VKRVIYAPEAEADIYAIARHIAGEGDLDAAYRFMETIDEKAALLATHPEMGRLRPDLAPHLRSFPVGPFVIFYRDEKGGLQVARVLRGSRDIPSLF
jgi:toxin ParE1/3/4